MQDAIIKGTGNSRYLKTVADALTLYPTYEAFMQAFADGTLPIDFNGVNAAGWTQQGTALNKANLLKDTTAALFGLGTSAVPDDVFQALKRLTDNNAAALTRIQLGSYTGTNTRTKTLTFSFTPKIFWVYAWRASHIQANINFSIGAFPIAYGTDSVVWQSGEGYTYITNLTWAEKTLTMTETGGSGSTPVLLPNDTNTTYFWIILG